MNPQTISNLKAQLRQQIRIQRRELSDRQQKQADRQLAVKYKQHLEENNYQKIAIYLHHDGELGTLHLRHLLFSKGCQVYLPKLHSDGSNQLQFCRYHQDSKMANNRYGIPEPVADDMISVDALELIFLPLTAFDLQGNRLGMGGGFYDRTLADFSGKKLPLVGLAYDFQQVSACPVESFDQPLQMILTPTKFIVLP